MLLAIKKKLFCISGKTGANRFPQITKYGIGNTGTNFGIIAHTRKRIFTLRFGTFILRYIRDGMNENIYLPILASLFRAA